MFLKLEKINENQSRVICVHYFPELLSEQERESGIYVDINPLKDGYMTIYNHDTKDFSYEKYEKAIKLEDINNRLNSIEEIVKYNSSLEEELASINYTLMMGGLV